MVKESKAQKVLVVGAGPVGALAALYAAERGDDVHVFELRAGKNRCFLHQYRNAGHIFLISVLESSVALLYHVPKRGLSTRTSQLHRIGCQGCSQKCYNYRVIVLAL